MDANTFIACDPGWSGSFVIHGRVNPIIMPMPKDTFAITDLFGTLEPSIRTLVIEDVHSIGGWSASSAWRFAENYYSIIQTALCRRFTVIKVKPKVWQWSKTVNVQPVKRTVHVKATKAEKAQEKRAHKNRLKQRAIELFQTHNVTLSNADALLLWEYAVQEL